MKDVSIKNTVTSIRVGRACGKIILSGNTANRFGKRALAVPVDLDITATWSGSNDSEPLHVSWGGHEKEDIWLATVHRILNLIEERIGRLSGELIIRNTLPLGKGMGSSTAIVIALARCFLGKNCKLEALAIEDTINVGHSGLDFASIWEERPLVAKGASYEFIDLPESLQRGVLVDTGLPTAPTSIIIGDLKKRLQAKKSLMSSVELIGDCTERLLSGEDPLTVFPDHYRGLLKLGVVPPRVQLLIERIQRSGGAAKPGRFGGASGGAGMVFAVHPKVHILKKILGSGPLLLTYDAARGCFATANQKLLSRGQKPIAKLSSPKRTQMVARRAS
jgi:mevalonate kinase